MIAGPRRQAAEHVQHALADIALALLKAGQGERPERLPSPPAVRRGREPRGPAPVARERRQHPAHEPTVEEPGLGMANIPCETRLGPAEPGFLDEDRELACVRPHP